MSVMMTVVLRGVDENADAAGLIAQKFALQDHEWEAAKGVTELPLPAHLERGEMPKLNAAGRPVWPGPERNFMLVLTDAGHARLKAESPADVSFWGDPVISPPAARKRRPKGPQA
jgi:hypothetical protein